MDGPNRLVDSFMVLDVGVDGPVRSVIGLRRMPVGSVRKCASFKGSCEAYEGNLCLHDNVSSRRLLVSLGDLADICFDGLFDYCHSSDGVVAPGIAA